MVYFPNVPLPRESVRHTCLDALST
jgi:hypothetical protein